MWQRCLSELRHNTEAQWKPQLLIACFVFAKQNTFFSFFFFCTSLLLHSALFLGPFYFRSLGSFATRTHMDVANRLSGSYQFDIRINNAPVTNEDPTVKGATCGGMSGAAVKSSNCLPSPSKHAHMCPPLQLLTWPLDVLIWSLHVKELHHILMLAGIHESFTNHFAKLPVWKNNTRHPPSIQFL